MRLGTDSDEWDESFRNPDDQRTHLSRKGTLPVSQPEPTPDQRGDPRFTTTHWSLVVAAAEASAPGSRESLEELCKAYWYPLDSTGSQNFIGDARFLDTTNTLDCRSDIAQQEPLALSTVHTAAVEETDGMEIGDVLPVDPQMHFRHVPGDAGGHAMGSGVITPPP